jgi:hypothetical protein
VQESNSELASIDYAHPDLFGHEQVSGSGSQPSNESKHVIIEALTENMGEDSLKSPSRDAGEIKIEQQQDGIEAGDESIGDNLDAYFKVDDKFRYALRSLAERQKQTSALEELLKSKQSKKPKHDELPRARL